MTRFGGAIEVDLAWRGVDLAALWRGRRWRLLLNLVDHLPAASHYGEAVAADEQIAVAVLDRADGPVVPRVSEWTPERDELTVLSDRVGSLIELLAAAHGGRASVPARPRPQTAVDRLRAERRRERHRDLVAQVLGKRR